MFKEIIYMKRCSLVVLVWVLCVCMSSEVQAQQDPQFTQYMYNTMSVNPAYSGSKGHATLIALGRTQWVGFDGAPDTQTLSYDSPIGHRGLGLGLNLVNDKIGPAHEFYLDANLSYTIDVSENAALAFGLKLGGRVLIIDWSKGNIMDEGDEVFSGVNNINNKFLPSIGAGVFIINQNGM